MSCYLLFCFVLVPRIRYWINSNNNNNNNKIAMFNFKTTNSK